MSSADERLRKFDLVRRIMDKPNEEHPLEAEKYVLICTDQVGHISVETTHETPEDMRSAIVYAYNALELGK